MSKEWKEIEAVFKIFVEGTLIEHDTEKSLSVIADDVIGIGMGNQGIVSGKEDLSRILNDGKVDAKETATSVSYEKIQIRSYENRFGSICGVLKIKTTENGKTVKSSLGQMMGVRKERGKWWIYSEQATPLFNEIEEMEAYPIKFAENALEKYRQQEQIARDAQKDSVAIYRINFTKGVFEDSVIKNDIVIPIEEGDSYEKTILRSSWRHLNEEERYQFLSTFSVGNIIRQYQNNQTEVSMEYEMLLSEEKSVWMRTVIRLYMDKADQNLKGYLYVFDIDEEKRKELELKNRAERDLMTDLYNKKYSEIKIEEKLKNISPIARGVFFMLDLDHFKSINDTYGHQGGDDVIKKTADIIKSIIRREDIAGRLGGDEFCIYFHGNMKPEAVEEKAGLLCKEIHSILPVEKAGTSCSIGIVSCNSPEMTFEEVYKMADEALYQQKRKGRNGYTIAKVNG